MSETKWTPGPWQSIKRMVGDENDVLLFAANLDMPDEVARANCRLAAAAPELYEALEDLAALGMEGIPEVDRARAVLAKARGET